MNISFFYEAERKQSADLPEKIWRTIRSSMEWKPTDQVATEMDHQQHLSDWNLTETSTDNNSDVHTEWEDLYDRTLEGIIVPCLFAAILITGIVGNTLLILSFVRHKTLSTPHNALVVNLASGDFIFLITSLPFNMLLYTFSNWPFGLAVCKLTHFAESLATAVVISTLSFLSIERCLIVTGKKLWRRQKRGPILLTVAIWSISLLVSLPNLITTNLSTQTINNETFVFCMHFDESWFLTLSKIHVGFFFIFFFCIPLIVISTAYILIAVHLISRAFPFSQSKVKTQKTNGKIYLRCLGTKKDKDMSMELTSNNKVNTVKATNSCHAKHEDNVGDVKNNDHIATPQQSAKSDPNQEKEDDKSCSPDSCTEMTELQQTPMLPYCFVYTGPIPTEVIPKLESSYARLAVDASEKDKKVSSDSGPTGSTTPTVTWKESSPQSPPNSGDMKPGYKQRRQTIVTKRRRLALTVLTLIIVFAVCWTPRHVYLLWYHFLPGDFNIFWHVFKIIGFCLASSNSAVNPLVFYILDSTYRSFVHRALCMVCLKLCRQKKAGESEVTLGDRDYNATIAMSDVKSKGYVTEL